MTEVPLLAVIFHPPRGSSDLEHLVSDARRSAALDLAESLGELDLPLLVVAPESEANVFASQFDTLRTGDASFPFGDVLRQLIRERKPRGLLAFGSGSGILLSSDEIDALRRAAEGSAPRAVFNNFYSCDYAAIAQAEMLLDVDLPSTDNPLGLVLADAGMPCQTMSRSASTQFDLDTPPDVHILRASGRGGRRVRSLLERKTEPHPTLGGVLELLTDRTAVVSLIGRLSPKTWADVEGGIACRTNAFAEGRGMRSHGLRGTPALTQWLAQDGSHAFFRRLAESCDAAIVDSRPLLAGEGVPLPPAADRFASDLFQPDRIENPRWKEFTEAAAEADIPILLGGHSVVSGGLYLMAEACWNGRDLERRLHPDPFRTDKEQT